MERFEDYMATDSLHTLGLPADESAEHLENEFPEREEPVAAGVRYLFYGGMQSGTAGLFQWKRLAGFRPYRVFCAFTDCPQPPEG